MDVARVGHVRAFRSDGVTNHILLQWGRFGAQNLLVTWSVVAPRGQRREHVHAGSEQVYIVIEGTARVQIAGERQVLSQGSMVYIPPGTPHSIANAGSEPLVYITAASPPFPVERYYAEPSAVQVHAEEAGRPV